MGQSSSNSASDKLDPTSFDKFKLTYTITTSNAELNIGNREIIEIESNTQDDICHGVHIIEKNKLKLETYYPLDKTLIQHLYESVFAVNKFMAMTSKGKKAFNTSGSDAGKTILLEAGSVRKEVKHSDQKKLEDKYLTHFHNVEQGIVKFNNDQINSRYARVQLALAPSLMNCYMGSAVENPTPFSVLFSSTTDTKFSHTFVTYMTGANSEDVTEALTIENGVWLPLSQPFKLTAKPFSIMGDDDSTQSNSNTISSETAYEVKGDDKCTLSVINETNDDTTTRTLKLEQQ